MRYRVYLGEFEKKIGETDKKSQAEKTYLSAVQEAPKQKYPIFIWDTKTKTKIRRWE